MIVCVCQNISHQQLQEQCLHGAQTALQLFEQCAQNTSPGKCYKCLPIFKKVIREYQTKN